MKKILAALSLAIFVLPATAHSFDASDASFISGITINRLTGGWHLPVDCWVSNTANRAPFNQSSGRCTETDTRSWYYMGFRSIPSVFSTSPSPERPRYNDTCTAVNAYVSTAVPPRGVTCSFSDLGTQYSPVDPQSPTAARFYRTQVWNWKGCVEWKAYLGTDSTAYRSGLDQGWYKDTSGAKFTIVSGTLTAMNYQHNQPSTGYDQWDASLNITGRSASSNGLTYQITWHLTGKIKAAYQQGGCVDGEKLWDFSLIDLTGTGTVTTTVATMN